VAGTTSTAKEQENVTLSLPADVLREARHMAVDRGLSLSRFLSEILRERVEAKRRYEAARDRALYRMRHARSLGTNGVITWTRDALYER
jgi:hypothetical protein